EDHLHRPPPVPGRADRLRREDGHLEKVQQAVRDSCILLTLTFLKSPSEPKLGGAFLWPDPWRCFLVLLADSGGDPGAALHMEGLAGDPPAVLRGQEERCGGEVL